MIDKVVPMQPVEVDKPFDNPDYLYQIKWDGVRMLTYLDETGLRFVNRRLNDRTEIYPDLHSIREGIKARSVILDGEIVAMGEKGIPAFSSILKRDLVKNADKVRMLVRSIPVYYMVFDILYSDDNWLVDEPLISRQEKLAEVVAESERMKIVTSQSSGIDLFNLMGEQGMEGIVCKEKQGRYLIGERSGTWKKVKHSMRINAVVGGVTTKGGQVNSLVIGLYNEGKLVFIGKAGSGLSGADLRALTEFIRKLPPQACPFVEPPQLLRHTFDELYYVPPQLVVEVEFMEWTNDMILRQPTVQGFKEMDPRACVL